MRAERSLAEEFIGSHPAEAARVLERLPSVPLVNLLNELPAPVAAECLRALAVSKSAEILVETAPDRAGRIFEVLEPHDVAAMLRPMAPDQRDRLLAGAPAKVSETTRRLLDHPEGTAGALMDPRVPPLPADISVAEAKSLIRASSPHAMYYVYVVDRDNFLIGVLNLRQLMLTSSKQSLESLMRRPVSTLPSTADRAAILGHPGWRDLHALPVVDRSGRFLGVLRHETVRRLESEGRSSEPYQGAVGMALSFGELCWVTGGKIVGAMATLALAESDRRRGKPEVDRGTSS